MKNNFGHEDAAAATRSDLEATLAYLVRNHAISEFLDEEGKSFLVGSKGVGKSLLLLKKAIEKLKNKSVVVIPNDNAFPVDRLSCDGHPGLKFHKSQTESPSAMTNWILIWKHSILKSVLVNYADRAGNIAANRLVDFTQSEDYPKDYADEIRVKYAKILTQIVGPPPYVFSRGPFYFYQDSVNQLDDNPQLTLDKLKDEIKIITDTLNLVSVSAYVFIDNMDTYYEMAAELWLASTIGLLHAIREIRLKLRHIHVYSSVRSDIWSKYQSAKRLQFRDFLCFLDYTKDELLEVFVRPIRRFPPELLAQPRLLLSDPVMAFFGENFIQNWRRNGQQENIRDYILRHTLWRPRDLVAIGNCILHSKGDKHLTPELLRRGLEMAVREIRSAYLAEIQPAIPSGFDVAEFVQKHVRFNILKAAELDQIAQDWSEKHKDVPMVRCCPKYLFCILHRVGLLGYLKKDVTNARYFFHFAQPGELLAQDDTQHVPDTTHYAVHPILDELLPPEGVYCHVEVGHGMDVNRSKLPA